MPEEKHEKLIKDFHLMWDGFPGPARLIDRKNMILAANKKAIEAGFKPGLVCAKVGLPQSHRGCLKFRVLQEQVGMVDRPGEDRIRGWIPVEGHPDVIVHFSLILPPFNAEGNENT